jgi:LysM repeat protein
MPPHNVKQLSNVRVRKIYFAAVVCAMLAGLAGCDRMMGSGKSQLIKDAESKVADGNFPRAISLYESALDDSPKCADIHYRLALLYDDKLNDPLNAVHHFKRYLALAPNGPHANEVKNFVKRDELSLVTNLSGDAVVSRTEAARLKNENLALHKQIEDQRASTSVVTNPAGKIPRAEKATAADKKKNQQNHGGRSYVVKRGDTLASISRKFYKTSGRWKRILDANKGVDDPENLKVGQTLTIP